MEYKSNADNCNELYCFLKDKLGKKINFSGTTYTNLFSGEYFSPYRTYSEMFQPGIPFYIKFCKEGFLRISVGSNVIKNTTAGEKLAALSDFYLALVEAYGNPLVFYTTKEDDEELLSLQWSFVNKEEEIAKFKNDTYFDDTSIDKLIIINEQPDKVIGYNLKDETKQIISQQVGLPFELLPLIDENFEDYLLYTKGKNLDTKIDGIPITFFEDRIKKRTLSKSNINH